MYLKNAQSIPPINHTANSLATALLLVCRPFHRTAPQCNRTLRGVRWR